MRKKDAVVNCHIPLELGQRLKEHTENTGLTITNVVTLAITQYLDQQSFVADMMVKASSDPEYLLRLKNVADVLGNMKDEP